MWALDFQFDQTADGRILKLLHVVDEFTRAALAIECRRRIDADHTVAVLDRLVAKRGTAPAFIRCDNGPELTANALRDWCRFASAGNVYIEPGSPWQNPYVESFGSRVRDELLAVELFSCLTEARVLIEDWRQDYNDRRPYSALGMMIPSAFAVGYRTYLDAVSEHLSPLGERYGAVARWNNNNQQPPALTAGGPMNGIRSPTLATSFGRAGATVTAWSATGREPVHLLVSGLPHVSGPGFGSLARVAVVAIDAQRELPRRVLPGLGDHFLQRGGRRGKRWERAAVVVGPDRWRGRDRE